MQKPAHQPSAIVETTHASGERAVDERGFEKERLAYSYDLDALIISQSPVSIAHPAPGGQGMQRLGHATAAPVPRQVAAADGFVDGHFASAVGIHRRTVCPKSDGGSIRYVSSRYHFPGWPGSDERQ